ncbi:MAG TPA: AbrB/MazE/SpoVT family DNA-binding domain-containing protein [Selenomonadales bacterium]|nr:AbrB/MazE/SpoVT family DNA-binding domain-containing protein [Selenomonadales bacterium]
MQAMGIVRKLDPLGRIVLPMELRRYYGITPQDGLEILVDQEKIILRKIVPRCIFCGATDDVTTLKGKNVCQNCLETLEARAKAE